MSDVSRLIERLYVLLERLESRRHVNEVVLGVSTPKRLPLRESLKYGYWIDPDGKLIEVPRMGHAKIAAELSRRYGIEADDSIPDRENRWRVPFLRHGWVRVVTGHQRLTLQAMHYTQRSMRTVQELARSYVGHGEIVADLVGTSHSVFIDASTATRFDVVRKLNSLVAKSPSLPRVALRKVESIHIEPSYATIR